MEIKDDMKMIGKHNLIAMKELAPQTDKQQIEQSDTLTGTHESHSKRKTDFKRVDREQEEILTSEMTDNNQTDTETRLVSNNPAEISGNDVAPDRLESFPSISDQEQTSGENAAYLLDSDKIETQTSKGGGDSSNNSTVRQSVEDTSNGLKTPQTGSDAGETRGTAGMNMAQAGIESGLPSSKSSDKGESSEQQPSSESKTSIFSEDCKTTWYQVLVLVLTFLVYVSYHLSRKPLSVVKNSLHQNCSSLDEFFDDATTHAPNDTNWCNWAPFNTDDYEHLFGWLDVGFLGTYAACMFLSGYVAERMNLRYFLTGGMLLTGGSVAMFGVGYFLHIHNFYFYLFMQIIAGAFQSTGWPAVVATVGNWFGPGRRGAIMGLWNSHTSVGNILGALIPGLWADGPWGWSFIVPGIIIGSLGVVVFFFLVPYPSTLGIEVHTTRGESKDHEEGQISNHSSTNISPGEHSPLLNHDTDEEHEAISLWKALFLPGVAEFSISLFFAKLVSYTFLMWLPKYIGSTTDFTPEKAADLSTLFDVGGVVGGFLAGAVTDYNKSPGFNCVIMLLMGTPMLFIYQHFGSNSYGSSIALLLVCGAFVNGPYALITTAVSADLGTQPALKGNKKALATVTSIIDGTGSIGAALGPLLTGWISPTGWSNVFYMLIGANIVAAFFLARVVIRELRAMCCPLPRELLEQEETILPDDVVVSPHYLETGGAQSGHKM